MLVRTQRLIRPARAVLSKTCLVNAQRFQHIIATPPSFSPSYSQNVIPVTNSTSCVNSRPFSTSAADATQEKIAKDVKKSPCVLYMKGYPEQPMCGYSSAVVKILKMEGATFDSYNVLEDDNLRDGIKKYSNWPTIPQVYISGEFVGGADIMLDLHKSGELAKALDKAGAVKSKK